MAWATLLTYDFGPPANPDRWQVRALGEHTSGTPTGQINFRGGSHRLVGIPQLGTDTATEADSPYWESAETDGTAALTALWWTPEQRQTILADFDFDNMAPGAVLTLTPTQLAHWNETVTWDASPFKLPSTYRAYHAQYGPVHDVIKDVLPAARVAGYERWLARQG